MFKIQCQKVLVIIAPKIKNIFMSHKTNLITLNNFLFFKKITIHAHTLLFQLKTLKQLISENLSRVDSRPTLDNCIDIDIDLQYPSY